MAWEDREAWERLEAEAADEAYIQELRRQHPELVEAEQAIFAGAESGKVIALSSDDEVEGGGRRALRWPPRTRRSTLTSGGVPSPTTVLARTRLVAHRTSRGRTDSASTSTESSLD